jgi:hypothetical protein
MKIGFSNRAGARTILLVALMVAWVGFAAAPSSGSKSASSGPAVVTQFKANPHDVKSIDAIMLALYDVISGPPGPRNWDRFRSLFSEKATLATVSRKDGKTKYEVLSPDDYVRLAGAYFAKNSFYENEIGRHLDTFGNIAQVFSAYASRHTTYGKPFERGINSIQLLNDGTRWWVLSILWDSESSDRPLPRKYLNQAK